MTTITLPRELVRDVISYLHDLRVEWEVRKGLAITGYAMPYVQLNERIEQLEAALKEEHSEVIGTCRVCGSQDIRP